MTAIKGLVAASEKFGLKRAPLAWHYSGCSNAPCLREGHVMEFCGAGG